MCRLAVGPTQPLSSGTMALSPVGGV
jgi:hypothetical protein